MTQATAPPDTATARPDPGGQPSVNSTSPRAASPVTRAASPCRSTAAQPGRQADTATAPAFAAPARPRATARARSRKPVCSHNPTPAANGGTNARGSSPAPRLCTSAAPTARVDATAARALSAVRRSWPRALQAASRERLQARAGSAGKKPVSINQAVCAAWASNAP